MLAKTFGFSLYEAKVLLDPGMINAVSGLAIKRPGCVLVCIYKCISTVVSLLFDLVSVKLKGRGSNELCPESKVL